MDGGAAVGALPHAVFGRGPILRASVPPLAISPCSNHGLFKGLPFSSADCMYLFTAETFWAVIVNTFPLPRVIFVSPKIGLPMSYTGRPGLTVKSPMALMTFQEDIPPPSSSPTIPVGPALYQIAMTSRTLRWVFQG